MRRANYSRQTTAWPVVWSLFAFTPPAAAQHEKVRPRDVAVLHIISVRPVEVGGLDRLRIELDDGNRHFPRGSVFWFAEVRDLRSESQWPRKLVVELPVSLRLVAGERFLGFPTDRMAFDSLAIQSEIIGKGPQRKLLRQEQRFVDPATQKPVTWSGAFEVNYEVTEVKEPVGRFVLRGLRSIKPASDDDRVNFYLDRIPFTGVQMNDWERRRPGNDLGGPWGKMGRMFHGSAMLQTVIVPSSRLGNAAELGTVLECNPFRVTSAEIGSGPRKITVCYRKGSRQVEYEIEYEVISAAKSP